MVSYAPKKYRCAVIIMYVALPTCRQWRHESAGNDYGWSNQVNAIDSMFATFTVYEELTVSYAILKVAEINANIYF